MPPRQNSSQAKNGAGWRTALAYALYSAGILAVFCCGVFLYFRADRFLAEDPRFRLAEPSSGGSDGSPIEIEGIKYASRARVESVFAADYGRSLYLIPLAERRRSLLAIDWVQDASVVRLWPNRLKVMITERRPVAFVHLPGEQAGSEVALIDAEGVLLGLPPRAGFNLPVLTGIRREQSLQARRQRVAAALRLLKELEELAEGISEIDVSELDNLKVVQAAGGRGLLLELGNRNFRSRVQNFLTHYPEIERRLPEATSFDLRLDDRITAREGGRRSGKS